MQVAFLIESLSNKAGMERVLTGIANSLCDCINVSIITACQFDSKYAFDIDEKITLIDLGVELNKKAYRRGLEKCLKEKKFDIVVSMGGMESYFVTKIKDGSKKVLWYHFSYDIYNVFDGKGIKSWLHTKKRNLAARGFDAVVALCDGDKAKWKGHCKRAVCIPNPLTIKPCSISNWDNKDAIAVGRLQRQKGFDMLIDAWTIVAEKYPDWKLNIYGEGNLRRELQKQITDNKLDDIISLCGVVDNIEKKYVQSSLLVCSSRDEAFGLMIVEAESCGLPIVTFDCPSAPRELVNDSENGYVVPLGDINKMAEAIVKIIEDDELRKEMGGRSVELARRFDVSELRNKWMALFDELVAK